MSTLLGDSKGVKTSVAAAVRPRVLVVSRAAPALGGIPAFAHMLCDDAELARSFDVRLLNTTRTAVRRGGEPTASAAREAIVDAFRTFRAARHADVVHIQTALTPSVVTARTIAIAVAAKLAGASVLCHVHSADLSSGRSEAWSPGRVQISMLRALRICDRVVCVSKPGAEVLSALLPSTPIDVVDNAVDVAHAPRASHTSMRPRLLYVGTLTRRKGLPDLLKALARIPITSFNLEIVGGGGEAGEDEADELRCAARAAGFGSSLVGPLSRERVAERMSGSDVFVSPSHVEGQPIAILEAMAASLPVVVTDTGANADVVRDGVDGFVVPVGDVDALSRALSELIASRDLRLSMGAAARERAADRFDMSRLRERLTALYNDAAASR